ncbi:unnamed protein product [marine sediment metagenome]|uniref:Uncharacterized protein n=1 Tax=marine sediment metagenome TaxID=412755 RepID=X1BHQ1_9ZZZZ
MKRKKRIWRYFFLILLIPFGCLLVLQYAQAGINVQILNSFSDEIQEWQNKGYELDELVITDLMCLEEEYMIAIFSLIVTDILAGKRVGELEGRIKSAEEDIKEIRDNQKGLREKQLDIMERMLELKK